MRVIISKDLPRSILINQGLVIVTVFMRSMGVGFAGYLAGRRLHEHLVKVCDRLLSCVFSKFSDLLWHLN